MLLGPADVQRLQCVGERGVQLNGRGRTGDGVGGVVWRRRERMGQERMYTVRVLGEQGEPALGGGLGLVVLVQGNGPPRADRVQRRRPPQAGLQVARFNGRGRSLCVLDRAGTVDCEQGTWEEPAQGLLAPADKARPGDR